MPAQWNDFILADEKVATSWGSISSNAVQQHSLIIAYAAHYDPYGSAPAIKLSGVSHRVILEIPTQPYRVWFPYHVYWRFYAIYGYFPSYAYLVAYYYYGVYPWWIRYWRYYWSGRWRVCANVVIAFADAAGQITMEGVGAYFVAMKLRVFTTQLSTPPDKAVVKVNFQRSDALPRFYHPYAGEIDVLEDDIVVLMGIEYSPYWWNYLNLVVSSAPNTQTLLDEHPRWITWPYGATLVRILRVKGNGKIGFLWNYARAGVAAIRLTPNVEVRTVTFPSIPPESFVYFEIQTVEDAFGNDAYPKEFLAFIKSMGGRRDYGVFRAWKREETDSVKDENGREVFTGWKIVEIWRAPQSAYSLIQQIPNVLVFEDYQSLKARITYHDERW